MKRLLIIPLLFVLFQAPGQSFTFQCFTGYLTTADNNCDICTPTLQSRYFSGLLIRRGGVLYRWVDAPYTVKFSNNNATFQELIVNPETPVTIGLSGTPYATLAEYKAAVDCAPTGTTYIAGPGIIISGDTISAVDTSATNELQVLSVSNDSVYLSLNGGYFVIAATGTNTVSTTGNVITINGTGGGGLLPLPYFTGDTAALAGGLNPGDPYLLDCNNDYDLPAGIFKVIKICAYDCTILLNYYANDAQAQAGGVPIGKEYVLDELNLFGILYGFIKVVTDADAGTYDCNDALPSHINDATALGTLAYGDHYLMSVSNTYGSPVGVERVVSQTSSTIADANECCEADEVLPYYINDADAISDGSASGYYYYLKASNTYGFPHGTKKQIQ